MSNTAVQEASLPKEGQSGKDRDKGGAPQVRKGGGDGPRLPPDMPVRTDFRRVILIGVLTFVLLFFGAGTWMATARLAGAVIAQGQVVVKGRPKVVQHLDGGIVNKLLVKNGDVVRKGQVLLELDDTLLRANLTIYRKRLLEALARKARLEAERDGKPLSREVPQLVRLLQLEGYQDALGKQEKLMQARRKAREGLKEQMREQIAQLRKQLKGAEGLLAARRRQLAIIDRELANLVSLRRKGLVANTRVLALERQQSGLVGQLAEITSEIGRTRDAISEVQIARIQVDRDFMEKLVAELHAIDLKIQELAQQVLATEKQLARTRVISPVSGVVHELQVHTVGGVIRPGQTIMEIVPVREEMEFELSVLPQFIDRVKTGQKVRLRFPAFDQQTTPEIEGWVAKVSPTTVVVPQSGQAFYRVQVLASPAELNRLGQRELVSGMPVEGFIQTHEHTALAYFLKPLMDSLSYALKE